ncbi:MAG: hypothetical protein ACLFV8_13240, partial [Alphaproteobacteria bacterium]
MNAGGRITEETRKRLADFLESLPAAHARALADCVERARHDGDSGLPHELILDALRPALEAPAAGQGLTAVRLFALPFEDLIVESGPAQASGCISRRSVEAVWSRLAA